MLYSAALRQLIMIPRYRTACFFDSKHYPESILYVDLKVKLGISLFRPFINFQNSDPNNKLLCLQKHSMGYA